MIPSKRIVFARLYRFVLVLLLIVCYCSRYCKPGTLDPTKVKGKILVCIRLDQITSIAQGFEAAIAGAVGVFVMNDKKSGNVLLAEPHPLPGASMDCNEDEDIDEREWLGKGGSDNNITR
jgi:hypothetical protein